MKRSIILFVTLLLLSTLVTNAQEGKPQYKIRNERAGVYIGDIIIELFPYVAPLHVANFDSLVSISFYDSTAWHRVVPDFVIQGGDPNSKNGPRDTWGFGDSTQTNVPAEFSKVSHLRGIIGAARDLDINSANSQFYINTADNPGLDGDYTAFGIVVEGMDIADDIEASPRDANDNPLEKIEMFITKVGVNESVPGIPALLAPEDGADRFTGDSLLVWTPVEDAVLYFVEIARDTEFTDIAIADSFAVVPGDITAKIRDIELGQQTFYWRVRSNNGAKFGDYSETRSFITSIAPPVPTSPADSAEGVSLNPILQWEAANGADSYRLQLVRLFPTFAEARLIYDETGITNTEFQLENLLPNTNYFWRVLSESDEYDSPYSEPAMFRTGDATGVDDENIPAQFTLHQNYPNPFNPVTTIKYTIHTPAYGFPSREGKERSDRGVLVTLRIYDILGNEIITLVNKPLAPGTHEIEFDGTNLPSGIYYYRLNAGSFSDTKKMILIK